MTQTLNMVFIRDLLECAELPDRSRSCRCVLGKSCADCDDVRAYHHRRAVSRQMLEKMSVCAVRFLLDHIDLQERLMHTGGEKEARR